MRTAKPVVASNSKVPDVILSDLWAEEKPDEDDELVQQQLKLVGKNKVKVPTSLKKKPNLVPAVQVPESGFSYNPSLPDYASLVSKVVSKEVAREKSEQRIQRSVTSHYQPKSRTQIENEYMEEMTQGLDSTDEPDESVEVETSVRKKVIRAEDRKTKAQRNREMRIRRAMEESRSKKAEAKRAKQPLGLPKLMKQIKEQELESQRRQKLRQVRKVRLLSQPKKKVMDLLPDQAIPAAADLTGSLRKVKVAANHLEDRFKSIVARNLVEPPVSRKRKSGRSLPTRKLYQKRSHATTE